MRVFLFALLALSIARITLGCPFCTALAPSLRDEFTKYDYIASAVCEGRSATGDAQAIHDFRIAELLKEPASIPKVPVGRMVGSVVEGYSNERVNAGATTLMFGIEVDGTIAWAPSKPLSNESLSYVEELLELREVERLQGHSASMQHGWLDLFWKHLDSRDDWVRADAYNAVAAFSIADLKPWAKTISAKEVTQRISQSRTPRQHRRFYWTILALCGDVDDGEFVKDSIEGQFKRREGSRFSSDRIGLDAAISCFLFLGKEEALEAIESDYFGDSTRHSSEKFALLSALRVHTQEFDAIEKKRIGTTLSLLLNDVALADQVIPDLARLEDWTHVPALMKLYEDAAGSQQFVRVPIINYLRACPIPEAAKALERCKEIDPAAYRRSRVIFPMLKKPDSDD